MKLKILTAVFGVAAITSAASAAVLQDFEGMYTGPGTVVADPDAPANNVLFLRQGNSGPLNIPVTGDGTATMRIYDFGAVSADPPAGDDGTDYGPRWGVSGTSSGGLPNIAALTIINRNFFDSFSGYGVKSAAGDTEGKTAGWFQFTGITPRRVDSLAVIGTGTPTMPDTPGDGDWTTYTFVVNNGSVVITESQGPRVTTLTSFTGSSAFGTLNDIWFYGGRSGTGDDLAKVGFLVDDVTFTPVPEPTSAAAVAGLIGLAGLRRRRA